MGLGEAIVSGLVPGAALSFKAPKSALDKPEVLLPAMSPLRPAYMKMCPARLLCCRLHVHLLCNIRLRGQGATCSLSRRVADEALTMEVLHRWQP